MNANSRTFRRGSTAKWWSWGASVAAIMVAGSALAGPLQLTAGTSGGVPVYDGRAPGTTTLLAAACGYLDGSACTTTTSSLVTTGEAILGSPYGGFIEVAGTTGLNPYGSSDIALAFIFAGTDAPYVTSATLSMLSGYSTSVEACGPVFGSSTLEGCASGTTAGMASRSTGAGDSITFSSLASNPILGMFPATDGYVVYTNAPMGALIDPNNFTVDVNDQTLSFAGFGLQAPVSSVPEPDALALFGAGVACLLALGLVRRRSRASRS